MSKNTSFRQLTEMKLCCLKCRKDTENISLRVSNTSNGIIKLYFRNAQYVLVKNQDLLKIKKQKDYWAI